VGCPTANVTGRNKKITRTVLTVFIIKCIILGLVKVLIYCLIYFKQVKKHEHEIPVS
jgi:heme/copper-type cytochrome/quinol oxidase subunit 2